MAAKSIFYMYLLSYVSKVGSGSLPCSRIQDNETAFAGTLLLSSREEKHGGTTQWVVKLLLMHGTQIFLCTLNHMTKGNISMMGMYNPPTNTSGKYLIHSVIVQWSSWHSLPFSILLLIFLLCSQFYCHQCCWFVFCDAL